jgi:hypothetical protein
LKLAAFALLDLLFMLYNTSRKYFHPGTAARIPRDHQTRRNERRRHPIPE